MEILSDIKTARELRHPERLPYSAEVLDDDGIRQARQMIAGVYVKKGIVDKESLTPEGTLSDSADPYWRRSVYYGVRDSNDPDRLLMAARLIRPDTQGIETLQVHIDELDEDNQKDLYSRDSSSVAEFAAFIKEPGLGAVESRLSSLYLIRKMVVDSRERGIETWIFGIRPEIQKKYERVFGAAMEGMGDSVHLGSLNAEFVPFRIDIESAWGRFKKASRLRMGSRAIRDFLSASIEHSVPLDAEAAMASASHARKNGDPKR